MSIFWSGAYEHYLRTMHLNLSYDAVKFASNVGLCDTVGRSIHSLGYTPLSSCTFSKKQI